jgi:DNA-3-methyladenine glycosylase I
MLWETLMLEGFQAGLSWEIIRRREAFRSAFAGFDPVKVAAFEEGDVERLMGDPGIVRARAKIEATIRGARVFLEMQEGEDYFGYCCWSFVDSSPIEGQVSTTQTNCLPRSPRH